MLRELRERGLGSDDRQEETARGTRRIVGMRGRGRGTQGDGVLRKSLPFAAAFVAGVLLGRRRTGGATGDGSDEAETESDREGGGGLAEIAAEVRDRATAGGTESSGGASSERETEPPDAPPTTDQPSSMGSVAGEEERQRERETEAEAESEFESESESESQAEADESVEVDDEVATLSAPTTRGMPMLGLGTYQMEEYDQCYESVKSALRMGYRHVDTAEGYHNEAAVGDAIADADVDREDLFVATKVSPDDLDYDHVLTSTEESLDQLGLDYVDLLYVHWPTGEYEATDTLQAFAELREEGVIDEIGVSNFTVDLLEEAVEVSEEPIFANQVEMHPLLPQTELQQFCAQDDVDVELIAYAPIARGEVTDVDELQQIADEHDATPFQVSLAWCREKGATAIPKATSWDHLQENWLSLGIELDEEDVERIDDIDRHERLVDPDAGPWNQ
jgi:2,5-diketo-D-gluconate reductase B